MFGATLASLVAFSQPASAVTLDFGAEGVANEGSIANGTILTLGGMNVGISATGGTAFLEGLEFDKPAGLGVCQRFTTASSCVIGNLADVETGESITLQFDSAVNIFDLGLRNQNHHPLLSTTRTLLIGTNGGPLSALTFRAASTVAFDNVTELTLAYGGSNPNGFYLSRVSAVSAVPLPATGLLLIGAMGAVGSLGFYRRRRAAA